MHVKPRKICFTNLRLESTDWVGGGFISRNTCFAQRVCKKNKINKNKQSGLFLNVAMRKLRFQDVTEGCTRIQSV